MTDSNRPSDSGIEKKDSDLSDESQTLHHLGRTTTLQDLEPVIDDDFIPLSDDEINKFFDALDINKNGLVNFEELEAKLRQAHQELAPEPQAHHLLHPSRRDAEKGLSHKGGDGLHKFLCHIMPECGSELNREEFVKHVRSWNVPSQKGAKDAHKEDVEQEKKLPFRRRVRAYWAVHGPNIIFLAIVVAFIIAAGLWQCLIYVTNPGARAALGWGIIVAKLSAGVIYPVMAFMLLSMSRWLSTFLRRFWTVSRFVNWDLSQSFHIYMSCVGLGFATLHAIGHLTGDFLYSTRSGQQDDLVDYFGPEILPLTYGDWVRSLPGWSGITCILLFWTISLMSLPIIRKKSYEAFQLAHLLMFPLIGLLCAHGTAHLLQSPMYGYWIVFPALLVIVERSWRLISSFIRLPAELKILDDETVVITCKHPRGKDYKYAAGQYILVQVPQISLFQWHPFTISSCRGNELQVHIKADGDWTKKLRDVETDNGCCSIKIGLDGPYGAPAQRFYDYDYSIIVGGGIGITPFSAILTDLEESFSESRDPWDDDDDDGSRRRKSRDSRRKSLSRPGSRTVSRLRSRHSSRTGHTRGPSPTNNNNNNTPPHHHLPTPTRRVDFHWTVREKNNLLWFSSLLNRAITNANPLAQQGKLHLNINTHITAKRNDLSVHIFRYILDGYRTKEAPFSALTGLKQRSHFGRPDFGRILERHFEEVVGEGGCKVKKVGVFYCGAPVVGEILSDTCHELTVRAKGEGLDIRYDFLMEVFG
ncbi:related to NADPH oxidase homolog 1 [Ramularia collo-cygni]|uniref:Related to NADPH oxidase homolog 1 n=1 Tax=Ramularia collo-cygni TaxID=112498 RepID=A0A2D3V942_9PEZI|nr:related to NADPH oxidase homolog 1 [Ramularia collo-cygni]CZT21970.1 related to NADPH oxidase homolog 1 [Ramularia collo-cygni]